MRRVRIEVEEDEEGRWKGWEERGDQRVERKRVYRGLTKFNASNDQSLNLGSCADVVVHPCQNWNEFQLHLHWRCQTWEWDKKPSFPLLPLNSHPWPISLSLTPHPSPLTPHPSPLTLHHAGYLLTHSSSKSTRVLTETASGKDGRLHLHTIIRIQTAMNTKGAITNKI